MKAMMKNGWITGLVLLPGAMLVLTGNIRPEAAAALAMAAQMVLTLAGAGRETSPIHATCGLTGTGKKAARP